MIVDEISMASCTMFITMHLKLQKSKSSMVSMVPSVLAQISDAPKAGHSKRPHFMLVSC